MALISEIKLDTGVMEEVAKIVDEQRFVLASCFESIRDDALSLRTNHWEGISADTYHDFMSRLSHDQSVSSPANAGYVLQTLKTLAGNLHSTASEFGFTEQTLLSRVETLQIDVFEF